MAQIDWMEFARPHALEGFLLRYEDGWYWSDGSPEPRCKDMRLYDLVPTHIWRKIRHNGEFYLEIPHDWRECIEHEEVRAAIEQLIERYAAPAATPDLRTLYRHSTRAPNNSHGYHLRLKLWKSYMSEPIGALWERKDDEAIQAKFNRLRQQASAS